MWSWAECGPIHACGKRRRMHGAPSMVVGTAKKKRVWASPRVVQQAYNAVGQLCQIAPTATGCSGSGY